MAHVHNVYDTDKQFSINPITRVIKNETALKTMLIQGDHNSERFSFSMPRYIDGHDMTLCTDVDLHYNNIDALSGAENKGVYEVKDLQIDKDDAEKVVFSWLISENATKHVGTLAFLILFKCVTGDVVDYKWHTGINKEITIGTGMDNGEVIAEAFPDILAQWKAEIFGDAENAVANINLAEKEALEAVQTEGVEQVENVKKTAQGIEAERTQIHLNNALKAAVIAGSVEGEVILLDDSAEQPFVGFQLFGKSEQFKTTGKNLLNIEEDCTFEGYLIISANIPAGSYILSIEDLVRGGQYQPYVHFVDNNVGAYLYTATKETEITLSQVETEVRIYSNNFSASGSAGVSATLQRLMLSSEGGTYEPYTGGIPSPNPEYPQEINSVENPEIAVCGSNLIPFPYAEGTSKTMNGITFTVNDDGSITVDGTATALSFFTFNYSGNKIPLPSGWLSTSLGIGYGSGIVQIQNDIYVEGEYSTSIQTVIEGSSRRMFEGKVELGASRLKVDAGVTVDNVVVYPILSASENVLPYEKGKTRQELLLPYTLHAIPVTSGGNYTDADGQKWICDEVDLERGVLVQRVKETAVNLASSGVLNSGYVYGVFNVATTKVPIAHSGCISEKAKRVTSYEGRLPWCFYENEKNIVFIGSSEDTLETLKEKYDGSKIMYILAEPIESALSETEISAFRALVTNYPTTTILNDSGANMAVRYGIDTKTYIDKKFAELQAMIQG